MDTRRPADRGRLVAMGAQYWARKVKGAVEVAGDLAHSFLLE